MNPIVLQYSNLSFLNLYNFKQKLRNFGIILFNHIIHNNEYCFYLVAEKDNRFYSDRISFEISKDKIRNFSLSL